MNRQGARWRACFGMVLGLAALSCGGGGGGTGSTLSGGSGSSGGGGSGASNVVPIAVSAGPSGAAFNTIFTTVTVCLPGTSTCQTIDNIQVDTGSYGLRLLAPVVTLSLPVAMQNGSSLLECVDFLDGYSWGPVTLVDLKVGAETAASLPVHLIGDARFPNVPNDCVQNAGQSVEEDTVAQFGANGLLGIGPLAYDCGDLCASAPQAASYYTCTSSAASSCTGVAVPLANQVQNPVRHFASDNNGVIIELPSVAGTGAASASGSLVFGVDTASNNQLGSATVLTLGGSSSTNPLPADLFTAFNGATDEAFIDSGSNGLYFNDAALPACASPNESFYCPSSAQALGATIQAASGNGSAALSFTVGNLDDMLSADPGFYALPEVAGTLSAAANDFDWGVPFFYGRHVAYVIEGASSSAGNGPLVAF